MSKIHKYPMIQRNNIGCASLPPTCYKKSDKKQQNGLTRRKETPTIRVYPAQRYEALLLWATPWWPRMSLRLFSESSG